MPRCKGKCGDETRCLFSALKGNYGFCRHHRGRKEINKPVEKISKPRQPFKSNQNGHRDAAAGAAKVLKIGTVIEYGGTRRQLKMNINGEKFWGVPL